MIRFTKALAVTAAILLVPSLASALGISIANVSGAGAGGSAEPGETVTFDLVLENETNESIFGLGVRVGGYDPVADLSGAHQGNISLRGGEVAQKAFGLDAGGSEDLGALENTLSAPMNSFVVDNINPRLNETVLFQGVASSPAPGTGQDDPGVGGIEISDGGVHFRVTFGVDSNELPIQDITFDFIVDAVGQGGALLPANNASFTLQVIPEPGTALLMGLGLAGLATARRR